MTKIQLKPITVTYTRTLTFIPTEEMFEDWEIVPSQEKFEHYIGTGRLVDAIYEDVVETGILPYTAIQQGETVEIDWVNIPEPYENVKRGEVQRYLGYDEGYNECIQELNERLFE